MDHASPLLLGIYVIGLLLFLVPTITFRRVIKNKSTEKISGIQYVLALLNCLLFAWYGLPFVSPNNMLVSTINGSGAVIEVVYVMIFLVFAPKKERAKIFGLLIVVIGIFSAVALVSIFALHGNGRKNFCGFAASIFSFIMYDYPLSIIRSVIKRKSVELMPFSMSLFLFLSSTYWVLFGLLGKDPFVVVTYGFGCGLGAFQLIIYAIYRNKGKRYKSTGDEHDLVKLKFRLYLFATLLCVAFVAQPPHPITNIQMVLSWSPAYCLTKNCKSTLNHRFYLHGLWPAYSTGATKVDCPLPHHFSRATFNTLLRPLKQDLDIIWRTVMKGKTNKDFWLHEYTKHGSCAPNLSIPTYFGQAIALNTNFNLTQILVDGNVTPSLATNYTKQQIVNAIHQTLGSNTGVYTSCELVSHQIFLTEIHLCLDVSATNYIPCPSTRGNKGCGPPSLHPTIKFLPPPP